jgi:hypothetical protein
MIIAGMFLTVVFLITPKHPHPPKNREELIYFCLHSAFQMVMTGLEPDPLIVTPLCLKIIQAEVLNRDLY